MAESIGAKLRKVRLERGLTIEDVAQSTCIRPDKLVALEADDYSSFPSMAYCRGFLAMYGKHLGVDVTLETRSMEGHNALNTKEYQYIKNAHIPPLSEDSVAAQERSPSVMPLLIFGGILIFAVIALWILMTVRRLGLG